MQTTQISADLLSDLMDGLLNVPKYIPSKYFYDATGSRIFSRIMRMPEYYLTDAESEIFEIHKADIVRHFCDRSSQVDLVELGAGDGSKTKILIREMRSKDIQFRYIPVDISEEANRNLTKNLKEQFEDIRIEPKTGDYFEMIDDLGQNYKNGKIIMFLGSNLGNYSRDESISFLKNLASVMKSNDKLFLGLDLKKDPGIIRKAYDDPNGLTSQFNINLLERMNRELGADFNTSHFIHSPVYDPLTGVAKSYLVSTKNQMVTLGISGQQIRFDKWEVVHTEISRKYDLGSIEEMASAAGFEVEENYYDSRTYFVNSLWKRYPTP